ncbi:MAG TPA: DUF5678 domain-containing protein [Pyrinomonadaceae bacterium]|nr:DUF5678 domain-containing protein [Pyrinomonadaceae bacterium]
MELTTSEIIDVIHSLPNNEQEKIRKTLENEKRERNEKLKAEIELYKKAKQWIDEHREEYLNQWVCLEGDRLISYGTDGMDVHRKAKESGIDAPFMVRIIEEPKNFVGAWL